ncbi:hypothetical protein GO013_07275 [Pseudodesulfovibrio sp. JC047]|uniref:hypothetical protein n=1 Tax=Pseudodesulfovibrio sp. JC047 TaxID=2683199 RepID=UPI0013CFF720|nr:hypothetical protein [Pseudodesulfovibrio sp. JC047]NDV19219.1 hypothetical protein [Pseudodesulfovibrio sp. JC047]
MADKTTLCNLALSALKTSERITSIASGTTVAEACALHWETIRDEVLSMYPWNFCTLYKACEKRDAVPLVSSACEHGLTNDVLRVVCVYGPDGLKMDAPGEWKRVGRSIFCDEQGPIVVKAICRVEDTTLWSPVFVGAFVARFASAIGPEIGKSKDAVTQYQLYEQKIATAKTLDSMEAAPPEVQPGEWEIAHMG